MPMCLARCGPRCRAAMLLRGTASSELPPRACGRCGDCPAVGSSSHSCPLSGLPIVRRILAPPPNRHPPKGAKAHSAQSACLPSWRSLQLTKPCTLPARTPACRLAHATTPCPEPGSQSCTPPSAEQARARSGCSPGFLCTCLLPPLQPAAAVPPGRPVPARPPAWQRGAAGEMRGRSAGCALR